MAGPKIPESSKARRWFWILLAAGALIRTLLVWFPRPLDDDTDVYAALGHNLLHYGTYGWLDDGTVSPSLFRLPGYPIFLALLGEKIHLALALQCVFDLVGCALLGLIVKRYVSTRAGLCTFGLAATCFFTAVYAASAMTECLSVFAVAASIYALGSLLLRADAFALRGSATRLLPLAGCAALAMLLRPDGALLTISIALALCWYGRKRVHWKRAVATATIFTALAYTPLVPWTVRNAVDFHVFQPLAPRHVNDPGERVNLGFYRWLRTWAVEYETTGAVYWKAGSEPIDLEDISPRAYDSLDEQTQTAHLIERYNLRHDLDPQLDDDFGALADHRIRQNLLRYYVLLPLARVADMTMRPRVDGTYIPALWSQLEDKPRLQIAALGLVLLNFFYVCAAIAGVSRRRVPLLMFLVTYVVLRCLLLGSMENPEPRYTLELYPILLVCAGVWLGGIKSESPRRGNRSPVPG